MARHMRPDPATYEERLYEISNEIPILGENIRQTMSRKSGVNSMVHAAKAVPEKRFGLQCDNPERFDQISRWLKELGAPPNISALKSYEEEEKEERH